jgi:hypothetical protein
VSEPTYPLLLAGRRTPPRAATTTASGADHQMDLAHASRVTYESWKNRGLKAKLLE